MHTIKHRFEILKSVAFVTYKEWSAYRTHSMVSILVGPVYFIIQYFIWKAVYGGSSEAINGMEFKQILCYYGAITLIGYLVMDFADWNLQMLIRTGKYLTFQLRPIHHRFFALSQKIGHRILGFIFEFLPCFFILEFIFKIDLIPKNIELAVISIIFAFLMNFYVNYCIGMTAFWLVQSQGIRQVYQVVAEILSGSLIPLIFFPETLQKMLFFLPFQYITYVPASVVMGKYSLGGITMDLGQIVLIQGCAVVFIIMLCEIIYRLAMNKYTDAGG